MKGGAVVGTLASGVSIGSQGAGSYTWTIPSSLAPGADYRIRIDSGAGFFTDQSDREFKIAAVKPLARRSFSISGI